MVSTEDARKYSESREFALLRDTSNGGDLILIWDIRREVAILLDDEDRAREIRANMTAHGRPLLSTTEWAMDSSGGTLPPIRLFGIVEQLLDQGKKAKEINPIWDEICRRRDLILETTWKGFMDNLSSIGEDPSPAKEMELIKEMLQIRYNLMAEVRREYASRFKLQGGRKGVRSLFLK